jgi:hypothetical protein
MPVSTSPDNQAIDYRYFVHDLMSNALLAEIPFRSVSYSRSLTEAGTFTGDIAVIADTYNLSLYENTLPAKTALYVVRNGVCVWGGIIWARNYSLVDKVLSISAAEFTSYLSHRVVWKTWNGTYEATAEVASGTMTLTLTTGQYGFTVGEAVYVSWISDYSLYNGYFEVESVAYTDDDRSIITVPATYVDTATGDNKSIPTLSIGPENPVSIETRQDNYQYAQDLLRELNTDLFDFDFANDEIRPGIDLFNLVTTISRTSNVATVTTSRRHELVPGQKVKVADIQPDSSFNNIEAIVSDVQGDYSFTYSNTGSNVASTAQSPSEAPIYSFKRSANVSTFETSSNHPYNEGDILYIENVSQTFDGYAVVYGVPASLTEFQVVQIGPNIGKSYTDSAATPTANRGGSVSYGTFGEFSTLGDIGFDLTQNADFSSNLEANPIVRGFELKTVADVFEEYSTKPNGFEYRVDCEYTAAGGFKK